MVVLLMNPKMKNFATAGEEKTNRIKHIPSVQIGLIHLLKFFNSQTFHYAILYLHWHFFSSSQYNKVLLKIISVVFKTLPPFYQTRQ